MDGYAELGRGQPQVAGDTPGGQWSASSARNEYGVGTATGTGTTTGATAGGGAGTTPTGGAVQHPP